MGLQKYRADVEDDRERDELCAEVSRLLAEHDAEERRQEAVRKRAEAAERERDELAEALRPLLPRDPNQDDARMAKARAALARLRPELLPMSATPALSKKPKLTLKRTKKAGEYRTRDDRFTIRHVVAYATQIGYWRVYDRTGPFLAELWSLSAAREWLASHIAETELPEHD